MLFILMTISLLRLQVWAFISNQTIVGQRMSFSVQKDVFVTYNFSWISASTEQFGSNLLEKWFEEYKFGRIRKVAIWIYYAGKSWRSESSNVSSVVLDKLLFTHINLLEKCIKQCKLGRIRQVAI